MLSEVQRVLHSLVKTLEIGKIRLSFNNVLYFLNYWKSWTNKHIPLWISNGSHLSYQIIHQHRLYATLFRATGLWNGFHVNVILQIGKQPLSKGSWLFTSIEIWCNYTNYVLQGHLWIGLVLYQFYGLSLQTEVYIILKQCD